MFTYRVPTIEVLNTHITSMVPTHFKTKSDVLRSIFVIRVIINFQKMFSFIRNLISLFSKAIKSNSRLTMRLLTRGVMALC